MKTYIVDSFTSAPFKGNPAGVCLADSSLADATMQDVARELGLSETAFVGAPDSGGDFPIRFFSPKMEIPLCGHATLAAAKVVFATRGTDAATFVNSQGLRLGVGRHAGGIEMEFPVYETQPCDAPTALLAALGLTDVRNAVHNAETRILLLEIGTTGELAGLAPDFGALVASHDGINGVLVTAPSGSDGYDFHSRYFWPWSGTDEDPVTGGTHTFLAKYWSDRLGKTRLESFQSSQRTGSMSLELTNGKLLIRGEAVIVFEGTFLL